MDPGYHYSWNCDEIVAFRVIFHMITWGDHLGSHRRVKFNIVLEYTKNVRAQCFVSNFAIQLCYYDTVNQFMKNTSSSVPVVSRQEALTKPAVQALFVFVACRVLLSGIFWCPILKQFVFIFQELSKI